MYEIEYFEFNLIIFWREVTRINILCYVGIYKYEACLNVVLHDCEYLYECVFYRIISTQRYKLYISNEPMYSNQKLYISFRGGLDFYMADKVFIKIILRSAIFYWTISKALSISLLLNYTEERRIRRMY